MQPPRLPNDSGTLRRRGRRPGDQNYAITDKNTISGIFNNGANLPIIHQWNIQRVE